MGARALPISVNRSTARYLSGCVILLSVHEGSLTLRSGPSSGRTARTWHLSISTILHSVMMPRSPVCSVSGDTLRGSEDQIVGRRPQPLPPSPLPEGEGDRAG